MSEIVILGLGPGRWEHLTLEALSIIEQHDELWLRTRHHPLVDPLAERVTVHSFDALYEDAESFAALYARIADAVITLGTRAEGVLYGVPGHPRVGEHTVTLILERAEAAGIPVRLVEGLSFIEPSLSAVGHDALEGLQIADAAALASRHVPPFDADRPVLLGQLYSRLLATDVKLTLLELYPPEHPVTRLHAAGTAEAGADTGPLHELDHHDDFGVLTSLWIPPRERPGSLMHLHEIVAHLRAPEGCPWDQEQDHESLRGALIEEAYEAADAIDRGAWGDLREELGDVMLGPVMHAQMANESGLFSLHEVIATISEKLVRRHPHVFGEVTAGDSATVLRNWEAIKAEERAAKDDVPRDEYDAIPLALPALTRAQKSAKIALRTGWQPPSLQEALSEWHDSPHEAALGTLLLAIAAPARQAGVDAEEALRLATQRLIAEQRDLSVTGGATA